MTEVYNEYAKWDSNDTMVDTGEGVPHLRRPVNQKCCCAPTVVRDIDLREMIDSPADLVTVFVDEGTRKSVFIDRDN